MLQRREPECRNPSSDKALSPNPREKIPRFLKKILWEVLELTAIQLQRLSL
jgi:hypothetical protein